MSDHLADPVFNATSNQWEIAIFFHELVQFNFSIQAKTGFGVKVMSDTIQVQIVENCLYDNITINASKGGDEKVNVTKVDGYPVMKFQKDIHGAEGHVKINLAQRFVHTKSEYCGFSDMKIFEVKDYMMDKDVPRYAKYF